LRQLLDDAPVMDVPDAIAIMLQVLDALTSAHEQGVVHQDIKPGHIMLTTEKRVKVGDFGISKLMNVEATTVFSTIGTPSYMSPEQCRGDEVVDGRSDIFSAGAMLFEMGARARGPPGAAPCPSSAPASRTTACRSCRPMCAAPRPACSWCSSAPWASIRRTASIPAPTWPRPCARCCGMAGLTARAACPRAAPAHMAGL